MKREAAARIPLQRIGRDVDIAACALYLASPAASWVTGHSIHVDGGVGSGTVPQAFPIPPL
jgi:NAD(P)-dependent dehydrogenase (short-subunit alcohol dehydrogenase family)